MKTLAFFLAGARRKLATIFARGRLWQIPLRKQCVLGPDDSRFLRLIDSLLHLLRSKAAPVLIALSSTLAEGAEEVIAWGDNSNGQTNVPAGLADVVALGAGYGYSAALLGNGSVIAWGDSTYGQTAVPPGLSNVVALASGEIYSLALTADGQVASWGYNPYAPAPLPEGLRDIVAVAEGGAHGLALTAEGRVIAWGYNSSGQAVVPSGLRNVVAIAAGREFSLALTSGGQIVDWGDNSNGTPPPVLNRVVSLAAGFYHCLALTAEGGVIGWSWFPTPSLFYRPSGRACRIVLNYGQASICVTPRLALITCAQRGMAPGHPSLRTGSRWFVAGGRTSVSKSSFPGFSAQDAQGRSKSNWRILDRTTLRFLSSGLICPSACQPPPTRRASSRLNHTSCSMPNRTTARFPLSPPAPANAWPCATWPPPLPAWARLSPASSRVPKPSLRIRLPIMPTIAFNGFGRIATRSLTPSTMPRFSSMASAASSSASLPCSSITSPN